MRPGTRHYVWLEGQYDNIGDSALRRGYAAALAKHGPLVVWPGKGLKGYTSGLGLTDSDRVPESFWQWLRSLYLDSFRAQASIALNAGEFGFSKKFSLRVACILPAILINRFWGQPVVWLGAGVPSRKPGFALATRLLARLCTEVTWRDSLSPSNVIKAPVAPDWGFALAGSSEDAAARGDCLGIVLRGDRPFPSPRWLDAVRELASRHGLMPTVVVQVERDQQRAEEVALALNAELIGWTSEMHVEQEELVRRAYRRSNIVVSDRLHALIIALTEGAVPLGWTEAATVKLRSHFDVVGLDWVALGSPDEASHHLQSLSLQDVEQMHVAAAAALKKARGELAILPMTWSR